LTNLHTNENPQHFLFQHYHMISDLQFLLSFRIVTHLAYMIMWYLSMLSDEIFVVIANPRRGHLNQCRVFNMVLQLENPKQTAKPPYHVYLKISVV